MLGGFVPVGKQTSSGKCSSQKWDYSSLISQFMFEAKIPSTTLLQTCPRRRNETRQNSGRGIEVHSERMFLLIYFFHVVFSFKFIGQKLHGKNMSGRAKNQIFSSKTYHVLGYLVENNASPYNAIDFQEKSQNTTFKSLSIISVMLVNGIYKEAK